MNKNSPDVETVTPNKRSLRPDLRSRFATPNEVFSEPWMDLNRMLTKINQDFDLPTHEELNRRQFPWSDAHPMRTQLYASRMWEYPFAILTAEIEAGMLCADIGCGSSPFTIALKEVGGDVTGFDPDVYSGEETGLAFGVSHDFLRRSELKIQQGGMADIPAEDNSFDRVFCISVIEHLDGETALKGMSEMARILRPGGRLIVTVDVSIDHTLNAYDPLAMLWHSGLVPVDGIDLAWPIERFGNGYKEDSALDVFGLVLTKLPEAINRSCDPNDKRQVYRHEIPSVRQPKYYEVLPRPRWKRVLETALGRDVNNG